MLEIYNHRKMGRIYIKMLKVTHFTFLWMERS